MDVRGGHGGVFSRRKEESIRAERRLDGIYVIRTSLEQEALGDRETVAAYKSLARVERAFRSMKSLLAVRPVFHWKERRVRAHLLLCMLAYYVEWHMRQRLAPLLFADEREDLPGGLGWLRSGGQLRVRQRVATPKRAAPWWRRGPGEVKATSSSSSPLFAFSSAVSK